MLKKLYYLYHVDTNMTWMRTVEFPSAACYSWDLTETISVRSKETRPGTRQSPWAYQTRRTSRRLSPWGLHKPDLGPGNIRKLTKCMDLTERVSTNQTWNKAISVMQPSPRRLSPSEILSMMSKAPNLTEIISARPKATRSHEDSLREVARVVTLERSSLGGNRTPDLTD